MTLRVGLLSSWASRLGGGVFEAMRQQALAQAEIKGVELRVFALHDKYTDDDRHLWKSIPVSTHYQVGPRTFGYAPSLIEDLLSAELDCLHLHGIWMYPSYAASVWARRTTRPYIISPHGMLEPWILSRGRWKKRFARLGYEALSWKRASLFHALNEGEAHHIAAHVAQNKKIVTLPNGVPSPPRWRRCARDPPKVVYLGRIHPKKNLGALIKAWGQAALPSGSQLLIAGWGECDHVLDFQRYLAEAANPSIVFLGPVHGPEKATLLRDAHYLILPSLSEGLPMTVLEAWAVGTPSLMTAACNLPQGFRAGAAREIATTPNEIASALSDALSLSPVIWTEMSRAAHHLAQSYDISKMAARWTEIYSELRDAHQRLRVR